MRIFLAILIAAVGLTAVSDDADARRKARSGYVYDYGPPPPYYYGDPYGPPRRGYRQYRDPEYSDSSECIQARSLDPGGNYSGYPCWARRALAPKKLN